MKEAGWCLSTCSICMHVQLILHGFLLWHLVRRPSRRQHHSMSGFTQGGAPPLHHNFTSMILLFLPPHFLSLSTLRTFGLTVPLPGTPDCSYNKLLVTLGVSSNYHDHIRSLPEHPQPHNSRAFFKLIYSSGRIPYLRSLISNPPNLSPHFSNTLVSYRFRTKEMVWS